jgi:predicted GNAT family acetyltransferase
VDETTRDPDFVDARDSGRFELRIGREVVFANYRREPGRLIVSYVFAPPQLRGTGASDRLMAEVAGVARAEDRKIVALCHYANLWLRSHSAHRDSWSPEPASGRLGRQ